MPELPEVETVARDLQRWVAGARITDAEVRWARTIRHPEPEQFVAEIRGAQISRVGRRAKSVLIHLADGRVMTVALRMTGALIVAPAATPDDPYARVVFNLADGRELRYRDVRKFGRIGLWEGGGLQLRRKQPKRGRRVADTKAPYRVGDVFGRHGPEPLATTFTAARLAEQLRGRSARLKTLLLDQSFVAGVGNIYADEALWRARLHPLRAADSLTPVEVARLHRAIRSVLRQGITNRGTSLGDYVGADDQPGDNAERLAVYRRTGEPCFRCGRAIERIVVGQRSTHFCPRCQKAQEAAGAAGDAA
jgi:formamidopyrimidine-DNA glycosylase